MKQEINHLHQAIGHSFNQLENCLAALSESEYNSKINSLFGATIGQHLRHIIELFTELEKGYATGTVNYEKRRRDYTIETDKVFATSLLNSILQQLVKPQKNLLLQASYTSDNDLHIEMPTNYFREVAYNLEHTVHHMALIRVGIAEVSQASVDSGFGIASSTIKYRQSCAQ